MARCKGCIHDNVCNRDIGHGYSVCPQYISAADVVPRAEVEELSGKYEDLKLKYADLQKDKDELIAWGGHTKSSEKTEVAREIFEKIEDYMLDTIISDKFPAKVINPNKFAEIKKKYTEGGAE